MTVEFRLLGPIEILVDGVPIPVRGGRQQSILAILLTEANKPVTQGQLLDRAWPADRRPVRPANAVQTQLTLLRRALAAVPDVSITRLSNGYRLAVDDRTIDLHEFRRLAEAARQADDLRAIELFEEALRQWRGAAVAPLELPWFVALRERLDRERHAASLDLTEARLRVGQHERLLPGLAEQTDRHPFDERLAGQRMLALHRSGRSAEAVEHYQRISDQLAADVGIDPGPALQHLHERILAGDPNLAGPTAAGKSPNSTPTPWQLPAAPSSFIGRTDELAMLSKVLDAAAGGGGTVIISAIAGAGGIGKTWLALHWAHQQRDRFPDGQLFVDLHGFSPAGPPTTSSAALRGLLHALGVESARIPADLAAQAALWRTLVTDKRMLIVLDNAADTNQVLPLLPGRCDSAVLITSRDHLSGLITGHDAHHLPIDILSDTEARTVLRNRLGAERLAAEPIAADELLAACGGFPLALGIVAGRAQSHPQFPLADLAAELGEVRLTALDDADPVASLPAVLSLSYAALDQEQARTFGLLALAPGPDISLEAAASLIGRPTSETRAVLRALERASLVQRHTPDRYRMHDLIRDYAAAKAGRDHTRHEQDAALRRVLDFYLHTAKMVDRQWYPDRELIDFEPPAPGARPLEFADPVAGYAWLDNEHGCLMAAARMAVARDWHPAVWQAAWVLKNVNIRRGYRHEYLETWRAAMVAADQLGAMRMQSLSRQQLGFAYSELDEHDKGLDYVQQALRIAEETGDRRRQAFTLRDLGMLWFRKGEVRKAYEYITLALPLFRALDDPKQEAETLHSLGWTAAHLGNYDLAREHCDAALALHLVHDYPPSRAATLHSRGYIANQTGAHEEAIDYYHQALALRRERQDDDGVANTLEYLGHPYLAIGQRERAHAVWQQAREIYRAQGRAEDLARIQHQLDGLDQQPTD